MGKFNSEPDDVKFLRSHVKNNPDGSTNVCNWFGEYDPKVFWEELGKDYVFTFSEPLKEGEKDLLRNNQINKNTSNIIGKLKCFEPKTVLEVGCGFGRCLVQVLEDVTTIEKLYGVDLSSTMIDGYNGWKRELIKQHRFSEDFFKKIHVQQARAQELPFPDKSIDMVYTHVCLTHIPPEDIPGIVKEISRVARKGIIHVERYAYPYEHPHVYRWSHSFEPMYMELGWTMHENYMCNERDYTKCVTFRNDKYEAVK